MSTAGRERGRFRRDSIHPPACATTLIVSLGLLSTPLRVGIIVSSVTLLVAFHVGVLPVFERIVGEHHPLDVDLDTD